MHITLEEAISLLDNWKQMGTLLRVRCSSPGDLRELQATVESVKDGVAELGSGSEEIKIDLHGAEFNGDRRESARSDYGAYLVCEYRNGDRYSFYAPRTKESERPNHSNERRRPE
jgi:hypothetical protein